MIKIVPIQKDHIKGFRKALDHLAREGRYFFLLKAPPLKSVRKFVLSNIKHKKTQFVALHQGAVIGWCDIVPRAHPTEKHMGNLGIGLLPAYWGNGIGAQLLRVSLRHAKSRGLEAVHLDVYGSNQRAIRLYKQNGFRVDGTRKRARKYQGKYEDLVLMSKRLK